MRPLFSLLALYLTSHFLQAQTGAYYLSHFTPPDDRIDFRSRFIMQDDQGELYFANRQGILEFDGKNWNEVFVPGAVHALAVKGTEVYVAGVASGGKLNKKSEAHRKYIPLVEGNFMGVGIQDDFVLFLASDQLIAFSPQTNQISWTLKADDSYGPFLEMFTIHDAIYLRTSNRGLQKVQDQKLGAAEFSPANLIFANQGKDVLLGMDDNRVFTLNKSQMQELVLKDSTYLSKNILVAGAWVNEDLIALGTLRGGVIFINATTGETEQVVDYFNGLPDNEVYTVLEDGNDGVWVSHEYGFTRITPQVPFRSFDHFPGLTGNLLCAQTFNGSVFVGTTLGLFELVEIASSTESIVSGVTGRRRRGIAQPPNPKSTLPQQSYEYKRISGIESKVTQLTIVNNKLVATGVSGLFEVEGLTSKPIVTGAVRTVFFSPSLKQLIVSTAQQIKTFQQLGTNWQETLLLDSIREPISHIFEDGLENVWLCGKSHIYKVETVDGDITDMESIAINNPSRDETVGLAYGNEVYIAASGQFSIYNHKSAFVKFDSLPGPRKYFASGGYFWFNDGNRWRTVDSRVQSLKLEWLGMFPNLRYLAPDQGANNLWVITASNELYRFSGTVAGTATTHPLYLREIRGQEISLAEQIEVEQHEGAVIFEFIQPAYLGLNATQYRYQVKGFNTQSQWSPWSSANNEISFSYLPPGKYQLQVQSRDLLGNESKIEQIAFNVLPPYWKRWWFYALEFAVFSLLVALSLRIGRANKRYRFVSQILSLLTIVMLVQFLQTAISSFIGIKTSPVIEFIIQVFVALAIFPIEIFARDSMMKYVEGKYRIRRIWDKDK